VLCTVEDVLLVPGMGNTASLPTSWLYRLIGAVDRMAKSYCKQGLGYQNYVEYLSGDNRPNLILAELPVWIANTTIAPASAGAVLPQATIFVTSVAGFPPGTGGDPNPNTVPPTVALQTGVNTWTTITYTGLQLSPPAFTGCSGGTGTLVSVNNPQGAPVCTPVVWFDPNGFGGQNPGGFPAGTMLNMGTGYYVDRPRDNGTKCFTGLIKKVGGGTGLTAGPWWTPQALYGGKLAGMRLPGWPLGQGNIKICYAAGFDPRPGYPASVPDDLRWAAVQLVTQLVRTLPNGGNMSSESLGAYSYSMLFGGENPELGEVRRTFARYRESSFGVGLQ
jgi:hypothetical protein